MSVWVGWFVGVLLAVSRVVRGGKKVIASPDVAKIVVVSDVVRVMKVVVRVEVAVTRTGSVVASVTVVSGIVR